MTDRFTWDAGDVTFATKKANPNHDELGRFAEGPGGAAAAPVAEGYTHRFSREERQALKDYTSGVISAGDPRSGKMVNAWLRNNQSLDSREYSNLDNPKNRAAVADSVKRLDGIFSDQRLSEGMTVYRGLQSGVGADKLAKAYAKGQTFADEGFVSSTTSLDMARNFAVGGGSSLIHITLPKGAPALPLKKGTSVNVGEQEVLLNRGQSFKIDKVDESSGMKIFHVHWVPSK
jgi:hypothetical protein